MFITIFVPRGLNYTSHQRNKKYSKRRIQFRDQGNGEERKDLSRSADSWLQEGLEALQDQQLCLKRSEVRNNECVETRLQLAASVAPPAPPPPATRLPRLSLTKPCHCHPRTGARLSPRPNSNPRPLALILSSRTSESCRTPLLQRQRRHNNKAITVIAKWHPSRGTAVMPFSGGLISFPLLYIFHSARPKGDETA